MNDSSYDQIKSYLNVSKILIASIRFRLRDCYAKYLSMSVVLIGSYGVVVKVDESVICRKGINRCPTSTDD